MGVINRNVSRMITIILFKKNDHEVHILGNKYPKNKTTPPPPPTLLGSQEYIK